VGFLVDKRYWEAHAGVAAGFFLVVSFDSFRNVRRYAGIEHFVVAF